MTFEEYQDFVVSRMSHRTMKDWENKLLTGSVGLSTESNEVLDYSKKIVWHGKEYTDEVREEILLEMGDALFYYAFLLKEVYNVTLQEIIDKNVEKLTNRYPDGKFDVDRFNAKEAAKKAS